LLDNLAIERNPDGSLAQIQFKAVYAGKNFLMPTPEPRERYVPSLDVQATFDIGVRHGRPSTIRIDVVGDGFPNYEAIASFGDARVHLGSFIRQGSAYVRLLGDAQRPMTSTFQQLGYDALGRIDRVISGPDVYSVDAWNRMHTGRDPNEGR
jgi:hypothetical protein